MKINVYYKGTEKSVRYDDILHSRFAKHLIYTDIDCFAMCEDGSLILLDECGNYAYIPHEGKYTIAVKFDFSDMVYKFDY